MFQPEKPVTQEDALKAIVDTVCAKLCSEVVLGVSGSADANHKVGDIALRTLDELRARVIADPAWLEREIANRPLAPEPPAPREPAN